MNPKICPIWKGARFQLVPSYTAPVYHYCSQMCSFVGCQDVSPEDSDAILTYAGISSQLKTLTDKIAASEEGIKSNSMECGRRIAELWVKHSAY